MAERVEFFEHGLGEAELASLRETFGSLFAPLPLRSPTQARA